LTELLILKKCYLYLKSKKEWGGERFTSKFSVLFKFLSVSIAINILTGLTPSIVTTTLQKLGFSMGLMMGNFLVAV